MPAPTTPPVTVDVIIELRARAGAIVLIERRHPPLGFALPGGFVDVGERLEDAAIREAYEETGLTVTLRSLLGCYSDPARDPRGQTVSAVYVGCADGVPHAGDDAAAIRVVQATHITVPLAFDHRQILDDYLVFLLTGRAAPVRPGKVTAAMP
ncbi:MAG: NUDIX hydrolase [Gammaproteobacteria bacterium]|nr:NUDIX hydrolase [Gammaproteobacteria bacterium]